MWEIDWGDRRTGWWLVGCVLALYAVSFSLHYPTTITVRDEGTYIRQARLLLEGTQTIRITDPFSGEAREAETLSYPVGTALIMAPFVAAGGWRAAFVVPLLSLLLGVLVTARWIAAEDRSPLFALLLMGFPATLVLGRVAMSDAQSLALVALGLWLFWAGLDRPRTGRWLVAGFIAGTSLMWREGNVLLFAPFFAGALLRRDRGAWALVVGGLVGASGRLLSGALAYGEPFFYKPVEPFGLEYAIPNLPMHGLALLVCVPGGLVAALLYRGRRRAELVVSVLLFSVFYLFYSYSGEQSALPKRIVLGHRFFLPLLPLLAFAMAESVPRLWRAWSAGRRQVAAAASLLVGVWIAGIATASVAVHPVHAGWSRTQAEIRNAIFLNTSEGALVITNWRATAKYIDLLYGPRMPLDRASLEPDHVEYLLERHPKTFIVLLDRSDSDAWIQDANENEEFAKSLPYRPELVLDERFSPTDRLRIWRVQHPAWRLKRR